MNRRNDSHEQIDLLRRAVAEAEPNFAKVTVDHLDLATPCEGWDLRALLDHVLSRMALSTRAARLQPTEDFATVEVGHVGDAPAETFAQMAKELMAAWDGCDDLVTPRVTPLGPLPPEAILVFGAQDVFVHAWDVATTLGAAPQLSAEMVEVFIETHRATVDERTRSMFFAPEIPVSADAPPIDRLVAFLGRRP